MRADWIARAVADAPADVAGLLAWVHETLAAERALAASMFGADTQHDMLARVAGACVRTVRARTAHALDAPTSVDALRLAFVLEFYVGAFARTPAAPLAHAVTELAAAARGAFAAALEREAAGDAGAQRVADLLAECAAHGGDEHALEDIRTRLVHPLMRRAAPRWRLTWTRRARDEAALAECTALRRALGAAPALAAEAAALDAEAAALAARLGDAT